MTSTSGPVSSVAYVPTGKRKGRDCSKERAAILADPDLGKITDLEMSVRHGVCKKIARDIRDQKGFPPVYVIKKKKSKNRAIIEGDERLGKMTDSELAELLSIEHGVIIHRSFVSKIRKEQNIAPCRQRRKREGDGWRATRMEDILVEQRNMDNAELLRGARWM